MEDTNGSALPRLAVSCAVVRGSTVLLVRRGRAPAKGRWAFPGGSVLSGERMEHAARREVLEETALRLGPPRFVRHHEVIERDAKGRLLHHYVIAVHGADLLPEDADAEPVAGDDAAEARFVAFGDLHALDVIETIPETLRMMGALA